MNIVGFEKRALWRRLVIAFTFGLLAFAIDTGVQTAFNRTAPATIFRVSDFGVVYCGAEVVRGRGDPYLTEPLRSCERRVYAPTTEPAWKVSPAPLPGYALAAVVPLGFLPFGVAKVLWIALSLAALCVTGATLAAIADRPTVAVMLILTPTVGVLNLRYGEPVPFAIAALCIAALCMQRRSPRRAAIAAAFAMLEPHVGLPAVVGLFVLVPATRWTLVAMGSGLAAISLATLGLHTNLEYFTAFLPAQAKAELIAVDQYSLSHVLYLLGMRPQAALALGSISYLAAIGIGVLAARRVVARTELPALAVLVPVAIAMLGGPFIHDVEIASAVPAAIVLAPRSWLARIALALLVVEWTQWWRAVAVLVAAAAFGGAMVAFPRCSARQWAGYALAATIVLLGINRALPLGVAHPQWQVVGAPATPVRPTDLSSVPWGWDIRLSPASSTPSLRTTLEKIPTWLGLALLPGALLRTEGFAGFFEARRRRLKRSPV